MRLTKLHNQIIYIDFPSQRELTETFLRFQEHYESPEWRGKVFTLGQFRRWYAETRGSFSYYTDWAGMNIPSFVFTPFKEGLFDPLTPKEQNLLDLFKDRGDKFYVIAGVVGNKSTKDHEIAHALYYVDPEYKEEMDKVLSEIPIGIYKQIETKLLDLGYCEAVVPDEMQAYLTEGYTEALKRLSVNVPNEICDRIVAIKNKHNIVV